MRTRDRALNDEGCSAKVYLDLTRRGMTVLAVDKASIETWGGIGHEGTQRFSISPAC